MRPEEVANREDLARALAGIREESGLSIREVAARADAIAGTVSGWFTGKHAPTRANQAVFCKVLEVCGVTDVAAREAWIAAAARARRPAARRSAPTPAPYRGFDAFGVGDGEWFFGRADISTRLIDTVIEQATNPTATVAGHEGTAFITVVGPSGAGKSSVIRAGLLSQVGRPGPLEQWRYTVMTPGIDPMASFDTAVAAIPDGDGPIIFAIDQLEEFWTAAESADVRARFGEAILAFGDTVDGLVVVQAVRADFYGALTASPRLAQALQNGHVLVSALTDAQLREVILGPARLAGIELADDLIDMLFADLRPAGARSLYQGSLPLLSHALLSTWSVSDKRRLTVRDYLATGRIQGAVEQTAERVYSELDYAEKVVARRQMLAMTHVEEDLASRRRVQLDELGLGPTDLDSPRDVRQRRAADVLERFAGARMITVADSYAEVTHETLFTAWPRLARWIDEDRADLMVHRRLRAAIAMWEEADRSPDLLPRGGRLAAFNEFAAAPENLSRMPQSEQQFLERSNEREDRARSAQRRHVQQLRRVASAASVFAVVAMVAAVLAIVARSEAVDQRRSADAFRRDAQSSQLALLADELRPTDPALAVQLSMSAYRLSPTMEARSSLIDSSSEPIPVRIRTADGAGRIVRSPDGSKVAAVGADNRTRLFDAGPGGLGRQLATFGGGADKDLYAAAFTSDGATLYTAGSQALTAWDLRDPRDPRPQPGAPVVAGTVRDVALSPNGQWMAVAADGIGIRAFRAGAGGAPGPSRAVTAVRAGWVPAPLPDDLTGKGVAVAFSRDGSLLAVSVGGSRRVDLFGVTADALQRISSIPLPGSSNVEALGMTFSSTGDLALAINSRDVKIYALSDPTRPVLARDLTEFASYVNGVDFSPDGRYVLGASSDNTTRVTDLVGGEPDRVFRSGAIVDTSVFVGADVAAYSEDGYIKVWGPGTPSVQAGVAQTFQFAFNSSGTDFITGNAAADGSISQWTTGPDSSLRRRGPLLAAPPGDKYASLSLGVSGKTAVIGSVSGKVYLADYGDPQRPTLLGAPVKALPDLAETVDISEQSKLVLAGTLSSNRVAVIDISDPARTRMASELDIGDGVAWTNFDAAGERAVLTTPRGSVLLVDLSDRARPKILSRTKLFESQALAARFSPDQRSIVVTSGTKQVKVLDISDPSRPTVTDDMTGPSSTIYGGAFSRDGKMVAAGSADGELWLWNVERRGHPVALARLRANPGRIYDVQFGPDDRTVLATGASGVIQSWTIDPERIIASVCAAGTSPTTEEEWHRYLPKTSYVPPCG